MGRGDVVFSRGGHVGESEGVEATRLRGSKSGDTADLKHSEAVCCADVVVCMAPSLEHALKIP